MPRFMEDSDSDSLESLTDVYKKVNILKDFI